MNVRAGNLSIFNQTEVDTQNMHQAYRATILSDNDSITEKPDKENQATQETTL